MADMLGGHRVALIDCCSLLNLCASRRLPDILRALPLSCAIVEQVCGEAVYILKGGDGDDAEAREPVALQPLFDAGLLDQWRLITEDEYAAFVRLAMELHDGEAATCALAILHGAAVITDERKTRNLLAARVPQVTVATTSQVVALWARETCCDAAIVRATLRDIEARARFRPGRHDPLFAWWEQVVRG